jgi:hypothetical protein
MQILTLGAVFALLPKISPVSQKLYSQLADWINATDQRHPQRVPPKSQLIGAGRQQA